MLFNQFEGKHIDHFFQANQSVFKRVIGKQDLTVRYGVRLGFIGVNIPDFARLPPVRVIDQKLRIDTKLFIQKPFVAMGDAVKIVNAVFFPTGTLFLSRCSNSRYRTVVPERPFKFRNV